METKKFHHGLPPPPRPERQFPHYLLRAVLSIALLVDGFILIILLFYAILTVSATAGSPVDFLFSLSFAAVFFAIALPAAIVTLLLYLGFKATKLHTPYD